MSEHKRMKYRCAGKDVDPDFRENYCGRKRADFRVFPCVVCDFKKEASD